MEKSSKKRRLRPSPGVVIGVVALVFAVSGVAVALPGKNNVTAKNIKKNAVTSKAIKNGSVTEAKLADGSVTNAKLGANSVTGAKVDESSLGKVPLAQTADKALSADKATTADKATNADEATNAKELEGRTLSQVRPIAVGVNDDDVQGLDDTAFEVVMTVNITIPTGGASVVINSALEIENNGGGQGGSACRLRYNGSVASASINLTMPAGNDMSMPLTAFIANSGAGTRQAQVECQGSLVADQFRFIEGDLTVQAFPIGG